MPKPTALLKGFEKSVSLAETNLPKFLSDQAKARLASNRPALDPTKRVVVFDEATTGLALIVSPKGKRSFSIVARGPDEKQVWCRIGDPALMTVTEARQEAIQAVQRVKAGLPAKLPPAPPEAAPDSFKKVAETFIARHVEHEGLREGQKVKQQLEAYVYPEWGSEPFESIRRGRVAALLDKINDRKAGEAGDMGGPVTADRVLATLRKMFNWYEVRNEHYTSPIVRGMRSNSSKARERFLTDDEIRALWADWTDAGTFGAFLKTCLLTAQRQSKVKHMRWQDISDEGVWVIPTEDREKNNGGTLILPDAALAVIRAQPIIKGNPYVFAGRGGVPIGNDGGEKKSLDKRVPTAEPWRIHDLRRTASTLMNRAGVRDHIVERVLGHKISGVAGVYNRHGYTEEKGEALAALAVMLERILQGEHSNVVQLGAAR